MKLNSIARPLLAFAALLVFSGVAVARTAPYVAPAPIEVPAGMSKAKVREAIIGALPQRAWIGKEVAGDELEATHDREIHSLSLRIKYDDKQVVISYHDSRNLNYGETSNGTVAHPTVMFWMRNLRGDLAAALASSKMLNK